MDSPVVSETLSPDAGHDEPCWDGGGDEEQKDGYNHHQSYRHIYRHTGTNLLFRDVM